MVRVCRCRWQWLGQACEKRCSDSKRACAGAAERNAGSVAAWCRGGAHKVQRGSRVVGRVNLNLQEVREEFTCSDRGFFPCGVDRVE